MPPASPQPLFRPTTRLRPSPKLAMFLAALFVAPASPAGATGVTNTQRPSVTTSRSAPPLSIESQRVRTSGPTPTETSFGGQSTQDPLTGSCGLGGTCITSGNLQTGTLDLPAASMALTADQPWDRVVKQGHAASTWQPIEFEARQMLAALHGVANDKRLPHFAVEEIRAHILLRLLGLADRESKGETLSAVEHAALATFRDAVHNEKTAAARLAVEEYNKWASSPCDYHVPQYADPLSADEWPSTVPQPAPTPLGFAPYDTGIACQAFGFASNPRPPTLQQFIAYGAGRASAAFTNVDADAALKRVQPALAFAVAISAAAVIAGVATILAIVTPTFAASIAVAIGTSALAGALAANVGVVAAGGPAALIVLAVVVTVVGIVTTVEDANILPELQKRLADASGEVDINAMASDPAGGGVLLLALMRQTLPDYGDWRMSTPSVPVPQSRPTGAPRFRVNGQLRDSIITFTEPLGTYQETFMADGWFVTRTSPDLSTWTPWRWALSLVYQTDGGLHIVGIQPAGFLDVPYVPGSASNAAASKVAHVNPYVFGSSGPSLVEWAGNKRPVLDPRSTEPNIVAGASIRFVANASDPDGTINGIKWFIQDRSWPTTTQKGDFRACGFGAAPIDPQTGEQTVCPWRPYDDAGAGVTAQFTDGGVFSVRVMAVDDQGATTTQDFSVNVGNSVPSLTAAISTLSVSEGQPLTVSGVVDYPRLATGYSNFTHLSVNWGDGTSARHDYPCTFGVGLGTECSVDINNIITTGTPGPWPFSETRALAFRPDRTLLPTTPIVVTAVAGGVAAPPQRFDVRVVNVSPTVSPFILCVPHTSSGAIGDFPVYCDSDASDTRQQVSGQPLVLRGYVNDVVGSAHTITTFWGDGATSVLQPDCTAAGCPEVVAQGPTIPNFVATSPWKKYGQTHTYSTPGTYTVKTLVNDSGPGGLVSYELPVTISGAVSDTTAPTAAPTASPAANANGWNNSSVTVTWNWSDAGGSGIDTANCQASSAYSNEGNLQNSATCRDKAGNLGTASVGVRIDKTAPALACAATPPVFALNGSGGNVSATVTDVLSGPLASSVTAPANVSTAGSKTVSLTGSDRAGNTATVSCAYTVQADTTAPTAAPTMSPAPNANGWNNSDVTVTWNWTDTGGSGIDPANCPASSTSSGAGVIAFCYDKAGNKGGASATVRVDKTAPVATPTRSPAPNANGWNNSDVTVTWNWADNILGAGIDPARCTTSSRSSNEGALTLSASCTDKAGNTGTSTPVTVKVDKAAPTMACAIAAPGPVFVLGGSGASVSASVTDALSGPLATTVSKAVDVSTAGNKTVSLTGTDKAGNTKTVSCAYTVAFAFLGFQDPKPQSAYKAGSTIPVKFSLARAAGTRLSDDAAEALIEPTCRVTITLDGAALRGCASYDEKSNTFHYNLNTAKTIAPGTHVVGIQVSADSSGVVNTNSTTVFIRP